MFVSGTSILFGLLAGLVVLTIAGLLQDRRDGRKVIAQAQEIQRLQNVARHGYGRSWNSLGRDRKQG